jgi:hypothetical protein
LYRSCFSLAVASVLVGACTPRPYQSKLDPLALQQMQSEEFETSKKILFASVVSVFQDNGYTIEAADLDTGIITARSATQMGTNGFATISATAKASAFVEEVRPGFSRTRLNFVDAQDVRGAYGGGGLQEKPNEDAAYYDRIFQKIREAVFLREANKSLPADQNQATDSATAPGSAAQQKR